MAGGVPGAEAEGAGPDIEEALKLAQQALAKKDVPTAAHIFGEVLQEEPGHPTAVAGLARRLLESGDIDRARKTLGLVRPDGKTDEAIRAIEAELALKE